ncbi:uncharacterized protein LOC141593130 [Silene latifolia]|uniref:uncharacterized protein LOC141593130 n=1 Tax=Silene latifolia TaxID=37657 RepID=UPI003D772D42
MSALRGLLQRKAFSTAILSSKTLNPTHPSPSRFFHVYVTQLQCSNEVKGHRVIAKPTWSSYIPLAPAGLLRAGISTVAEDAEEVSTKYSLPPPSPSSPLPPPSLSSPLPPPSPSSPLPPPSSSDEDLEETAEEVERRFAEEEERRFAAEEEERRFAAEEDERRFAAEEEERRFAEEEERRFAEEEESRFAEEEESRLEETAEEEEYRLGELLRSKGIPYGSYPPFRGYVKDQKIAIMFEVPSNCKVLRLIASLSSNLNSGSPMEIQSLDSTVDCQVALSLPPGQVQSGGNKDGGEESKPNDADLSVLMLHSLESPDKPKIEFLKKGSFSSTELDALVSILQIAGEKSEQNREVPSTTKKAVDKLEAMGVRVFGLDEPRVGNANEEISWDNLAGYDHQKREIEDTILMALSSPEVYNEIARGTREKFESNRPRAVLFEGPPGTGKTASARVIANQAGIPLLYLPLEAIMSKWYGESERLLGEAFSLANEIPTGAIIFLDEIDSFAGSRDDDMYEATCRILSVLLRQIDGFEQDKKVVVIGATNRKQDLDPALISRFDSIIYFGLPDQHCRQKIAAQYAKHLTVSELMEFASATESFSGREIRDVCQRVERRWASKVIRSKAASEVKDEVPLLPPLQEYIESASNRRKSLLEIEDKRNCATVGRHTQPRPLDPK